MPVLLIVGGLDENYRSINHEMADLIPGAELAVIEGARHNPLADKPDVTCQAISRFLDRRTSHVKRSHASSTGKGEPDVQS